MGELTYEEGVERKSDDVGREGQHHEVDLNVLDGHEETVEGALALLVDVGLTDIFDHAELGNLTLFLGEAARVVRQIGQDKDRENGDEHGGGTLNCGEEHFVSGGEKK